VSEHVSVLPSKSVTAYTILVAEVLTISVELAFLGATVNVLISVLSDASKLGREGWTLEYLLTCIVPSVGQPLILGICRSEKRKKLNIYQIYLLHHSSADNSANVFLKKDIKRSIEFYECSKIEVGQKYSYTILPQYFDTFRVGGLSLKIKNLPIHLYFIATKYLWNNAIVKYKDNWTQFSSLVIIIILNSSKYL